MQRESGKIFISCAMGAGIGTLVSLELAPFLWWVGLIVGGLTGYLSYDWAQVKAAVPRAWKATSGWRPPENYWRNLWRMCVFVLVWLSWAVLILVPCAFYFWKDDWRFFKSPEENFSIVNVIAGSLFQAVGIGTNLCILLAFAFSLAGLTVPAFEAAEPRWYPKTSSRELLRTYSSPCVLYRNVPRIACAAPGFVASFARELFVRIHSERRLLCGVDACLGAGIGYVTGSVIVGALVGGVLGVINYELVTLRWLVPRGLVTIKK